MPNQLEKGVMDQAMTMTQTQQKQPQQATDANNDPMGTTNQGGVQ
jgi:hypothetical protein